MPGVADHQVRRTVARQDPIVRARAPERHRRSARRRPHPALGTRRVAGAPRPRGESPVRGPPSSPPGPAPRGPAARRRGSGTQPPIAVDLISPPDRCCWSLDADALRIATALQERSCAKQMATIRRGELGPASRDRPRGVRPEHDSSRRAFARMTALDQLPGHDIFSAGAEAPDPPTPVLPPAHDEPVAARVVVDAHGAASSGSVGARMGARRAPICHRALPEKLTPPRSVVQTETTKAPRLQGFR